jgi:hypothetical protein
MSEFEGEDFSGYMVNVHEVVRSKDSLAVTRLLAADLIANPYMMVGDFFKNISDTDLQTLLNGSEPDSKDEVIDDILLITMMLRGAEGLEGITTNEEMRLSMSQFIGFLVVESLFRKGFVKLYRENMSFGEDLGNKILVEKV